MKKTTIVLIAMITLLIGVVPGYADNTQITWDCSCGAKDNTGNFCAFCGNQSPLWECPKCRTINLHNYCTNCGTENPAASGTADKSLDSISVEKEYEKMITAYETGDYETAREHANNIKEKSETDYENIKLYDVLIKLHTEDYDSEDSDQAQEFYTVLKDNIDIANAKEALLAYKNLAVKFLIGTWSSKDGTVIVLTDGSFICYNNYYLNFKTDYMNWGNISHPKFELIYPDLEPNTITILDENSILLHIKQQRTTETEIINYMCDYKLVRQNEVKS